MLRLLLGVALAVAACQATAETKPPLVTLVAGANQALLPKDDSNFEVRIPVSVANGKALNVRKLDVIYKEVGLTVCSPGSRLRPRRQRPTKARHCW